MKRIACGLVIAACMLTGCGDDSDDEPATPTQGAATTTAPAEDVAGTYSITAATNPERPGGYEGTVKVDRSDEVYKLTWTIANTPPYSGVAVKEGSHLAVGWGKGERYGVVVYRVDGGRLSGRWASSESGDKPGIEDLEGPAELSGSFRIVRGERPDGGTYDGNVSIEPTGATYAVKWTLPQETYSGVGIRTGDLLVVGWGEAGKGAGAVDYDISGETLTGTWATPDGTRLGTEVLTKQ